MKKPLCNWAIGQRFKYKGNEENVTWILKDFTNNGEPILYHGTTDNTVIVVEGAIPLWIRVD